MRRTPGMQGVRTVIRHPALGLAEVAWRWTTATVAWLLTCFLLLEYLDSVTVSKGDMFLLRSGVPSLALGAIERLLLSGTHRLLVASIICLIGVCAVWIFAGAVGRTASIHVLLEQARNAHTPGGAASLMANSDSSAATASKLLSKAVVLLYFWRAALLLATVAAFLGAALAPALLSSERDPHPAVAFLLFLLLSGAIVIFWYALDWVLSAASIFAIRNRESTWGAISEALAFVCDRFGAIARTSALFGAIHLIIFVVMTSLVSAPLGLVRILPPGVVLLSILAFTLLYFVLIDFLRVARVAAYISIADASSGAPPAAAGY